MRHDLDPGPNELRGRKTEAKMTMRISRRTFASGLVGMAAAGSLPLLAPPARADTLTLEARTGSAQLVPPDYPATPIWGYEGQVPGPVIRVRQGERVRRRFVNELPQASTVHWHGIRIENAMDGVPELTQAAVPPGGSFLYDFVAPDAGTYWYHSHNRTWEQLARGLYGALIVEEADGGPEVDRDELLLIDDWRLTPEAQIDQRFGAMGDRSHGGRLGNWVTINGASGWRREVRRHERLRLRLANAANARILVLELHGLEGWVVALDGQPLAAPEPVGRLLLAPGQRADLIVDATAEEGSDSFLVSLERDGGYAIATFPVDGIMRPQRLAAPPALEPNPVSPLRGLAAARPARLLMQGGAMGGMQSAIMGGRETEILEMAAHGKVWAFNGVADFPAHPLLELATGERARIAIVNETAWPHAMHLHGHHFRRIGEDGTIGPLRDTLLLDRQETAEIAFVADNPGDWLLHCHMPEHSAGGMETWIRVG